MKIAVHYPDNPATAAPRLRSAPEIWAVAAQVRHQLLDGGSGPISADLLMNEVDVVVVNGRRFDVIWDGDHVVHDNDEREVLGVCETDRDSLDNAYVSINGPKFAGRPDLLVSTVAHELGHVVFDVPAGGRHFRAVTRSIGTMLAAERISEWRANEFMGALLVPAYQLHRDLLRRARSERLPLIRAPHRGRPGCPVVDPAGRPDALAGIIAALADRFGVSDGFLDVRLRRYGLIAEGGGASS